MGFKFTDYASQDISWKICCSSLLLMNLWQSLLVCFGSLSCMSKKSLTHKPHFRWDCVVLQYAVIASLIEFALHLVQIHNFAISESPLHHNKNFTMLYAWCETGGYSSFTNSLLHWPPIWPKEFKVYFFNPKVFISLLCCPVFVHLGPLKSFDIVLLP